MAFTITPAAKREPLTRHYRDLAGVDFSSLPSAVAPNRSPEAKNVYKDYRATNGQAIETRPGIAKLGTLSGAVHGMHIYGAKCLVHHGTALSEWVSFPSEIAQAGDVSAKYSGMADHASVSFLFGEKFYLLDGAHYLVYGGASVAAVGTSATVPTTSIGADPNGGNRQTYQEINLLSHYRKNSFAGNGTSTVYYLDTTGLDASSAYTMQAWVNGVLKTEGSDFSVNRTAGSVTFSTAPAAPATAGTDNVVIQFRKTMSGNAEKITNCTIARTFDNRVFFTGNPDYPNAVFHCELDDASYFRETAYYTDGEDDAEIKALIRGSDVLIAVKENRGSGCKVYLHSPSLDSSLGKVYPVTATEIALGASCTGINFSDDIVYLSPMGLEAIAITSTGASLKHRSTMVDRRLINESDAQSMKAEIWNNYLVISAGSRMYLADSRQMFRGSQNVEYEWYFWENVGVSSDDGSMFYAATCLREHGGSLYFGCENGTVCVFSGTTDCGAAIESYWTTPMDNFGTMTYYKQIERAGGAAEIKRIQNSIIKVDVQTDKENWENVLRSTTAGFSFLPEKFSFVEFSFGTGVRGKIIYKTKKRRVKEVSLKFYSDEIGKPFGLYEATLSATVMNTVK